MAIRGNAFDVSPGTQNDKLVGTWKLVSASSTTSSGERSETPYGANPAGFLTYTEMAE